MQDVRGPLTLLRARGGVWQQALAEDRVQVMENKLISPPEAKIIDSNEIAIVSSSPF